MIARPVIQRMHLLRRAVEYGKEAATWHACADLHKTAEHYRANALIFSARAELAAWHASRFAARLVP